MGTTSTHEAPSPYIRTRGTRISTPAHKQRAGTCYAYSTTTIVRAALKRIDDWHVPQHDTLCYDIIEKFGLNGAKVEEVLQYLQESYPIRWRTFTEYNEEVRVILNEKRRPLLGSFRLCGKGWNDLKKFFEESENGKQVLTKEDISCRVHNCRDPLHSYNDNAGYGRAGGHSVAIESSFNRFFIGKECFRIKNSWGEQWGDNGYFLVETDALNFYCFKDVYYTVNDLYEPKYEHGRILHKELELENKFLKFYYRRRIGKGSFGTVYEADDGYVVKVIENDSIENKTALSKWECGKREVHAYMEYVGHPSIVQYIDSLEMDNKMYIILKAYKDRSLAYRLSLEQRNSVDNYLIEMYRYMRDIAEGLEYIHIKGHIHRDINPHNLFIEDGRCYIGDFGLTLFSKRYKATKNSMIYGTTGYIAPEILEGKDYDQSVDIYSCGITFREMLFKVDDDIDIGIFEPTPTFRSYYIVKDLCNRMIHSDPSKRPTAEEVREFFSSNRNASWGIEINELYEKLMQRTRMKNFNSF